MHICTFILKFNVYICEVKSMHIPSNTSLIWSSEYSYNKGIGNDFRHLGIISFIF